eukprot:573474-Amphidinium_carterae.1
MLAIVASSSIVGSVQGPDDSDAAILDLSPPRPEPSAVAEALICPVTLFEARHRNLTDWDDKRARLEHKPLNWPEPCGTPASS